jgi:hypothetical protein
MNQTTSTLTYEQLIAAKEGAAGYIADQLAEGATLEDIRIYLNVYRRYRAELTRRDRAAGV